MHTIDGLRERIDRSRIPFVALATYVVALVAWVALVERWLPMPGSGTGTGAGTRMADPGAPEAMALANGPSGVGLYLLMWGVMMVAMMYPATVPLFRLYNGTLRDTTTPERTTRLGAFMGTYALVWALTGVVPLAVNRVVPVATVADESGAVLLGGSLVVLSAYQLSSYKHRCLDYCRSPLGFLTEHYRPGIRGAIRLSGRFSVFCIGCCWALMGLMVVVGSMNLLWMAGITVVMSLERMVSWGDRLATAIGVVSGVVGVGLVGAGLVPLVG
jgi:predicted metal-binding membrane protein